MAKSNKRRDEERRRAAAEKVAEMQRAQKVAERRQRSLMVSAIAVAVIVVIVGVFVLVQHNKSTPTVAAAGVGGSTGNYGFVVGKPNAPASMVVYEDFQCPVCKQFETTDGSTIQKYITDGKLKVEFRPIAFLDRMSQGTEYSSRSLNAAACVRNYTDATTFKLFHDLLFKVQPAENTSGLTDAQLVDYASKAGATQPAVATCITDRTYKDWVASATEAASKAGVTGTPTVKLNGQDVPLDTLASPDSLKALLDNAIKTNTN